MSRQWLIGKVPGFGDLPPKDRSALFNFVLIWTLFEAQIMNNRAQVDRIVAKVDEWHVSSDLNADIYDDVLAYFRKRYFKNGDFTGSFGALNLRPSDQPALVRAVVDGSDNDPRNRVLAILLIIWRYRNNLFHGEKWTYKMKGQRDNFTHASKALMQMIERHGNFSP